MPGRPGPQAGHRTQVLPFERSRAFETNPEESRVKLSHGDGSTILIREDY